VLDELVVGALRYPHIAFAHLRGPITQQRYDTPALERLRDFLDALHARLGRSLRARGALHRRAALSQLWSVILMTGLLPRLRRDAGRRILSVAAEGRRVDRPVRAADMAGMRTRIRAAGRHEGPRASRA
jgi:hypothetical protein